MLYGRVVDPSENYQDPELTEKKSNPDSTLETSGTESNPPPKKKQNWMRPKEIPLTFLNQFFINKKE